ncbi:hypothetical protein PoHVEF18_006138 [Penicillium ochrochloron]
MATSTKLVVAAELPEPSLDASPARNVSLESPETPSTSRPESLDFTKTCEAQPARAKTSNQPAVEKIITAVAAAPITPPDTLTSDRITPSKNVDDKNKTTTQNVSWETPDSPATLSSSLTGPVTATIQAKPYESPEVLS